HVLHEELRLRSGHLEPHVEPGILRDVDRAGESWAAVELPVEAGAEHRGVLHRIGQAGLVLAEIDPLRRLAVAADAELDAEEAAARRRGDVHVDDRVPHLEPLERRRATVETDGGAPLVVDDLRLSLEFPARGVRRYRHGCRGRSRGERSGGYGTHGAER